MNALLEFLTEVGTNPHQQLAFANAPKDTMKLAGLTDLEQQLIQKGDPKQISALFTQEHTVLAVSCVDPIEDPLPDPDPPSDPDSSEQ